MQQAQGGGLSEQEAVDRLVDTWLTFPISPEQRKKHSRCLFIVQILCFFHFCPGGISWLHHHLRDLTLATFMLRGESIAYGSSGIVTSTLQRQCYDCISKTGCQGPWAYLHAPNMHGSNRTGKSMEVTLTNIQSLLNLGRSLNLFLPHLDDSSSSHFVGTCSTCIPQLFTKCMFLLHAGPVSQSRAETRNGAAPPPVGLAESPAVPSPTPNSAGAAPALVEMQETTQPLQPVPPTLAAEPVPQPHAELASVPAQYEPVACPNLPSTHGQQGSQHGIQSLSSVAPASEASEQPLPHTTMNESSNQQTLPIAMQVCIPSVCLL